MHWRSDAPDGIRGGTDGHAIWMPTDLLQVERRCVLAHELEHIARGHETCQDARTEREVRHHAARFLLPDPVMIGDALAWAAGDIEEAADALWVTPDTLAARLDYGLLSCSELEVMRERVAAVERGA